jgi:hypothetical protein
MRKIWLDDVRPAPEGWEWVKNANEFIAAMGKDGSDIEAISFDNDLGLNSPEGWEIAKRVRDAVHLRVIEFPFNIVLEVHSMNPVARKNIENIIGDIKGILLDREE